MTFLVNNCNHWISYHIIEELLNDGHSVEGIINEEKDDDLLMYFGRNSHFSIAEDYKSKRYDTVISLGIPLSGVNTTFMHVVNPAASDFNKEGVTCIQAPLLFGEWMPMNEKGMYVNKKFIPFDSEYFLTKAIYIKDFTKAFNQWMQSVSKNEAPEIISNHAERKWLKLENLIYLRDNRPVKEQLKEVIAHYTMYRKFYNGK